MKEQQTLKPAILLAAAAASLIGMQARLLIARRLVVCYGSLKEAAHHHEWICRVSLWNDLVRIKARSGLLCVCFFGSEMIQTLKVPSAEACRMPVNTVKVSNVSMKATDKELKEFFSFSGDIQYVQMQTSSEDEKTQVGYVTFKDSEGAETAILLSGATIVDLAVTISLDPYYKLPQSVLTAMVTTNFISKEIGKAYHDCNLIEVSSISALVSSIFIGLLFGWGVKPMKASRMLGILMQRRP
ncbi:Binding partner of ACD11 1 [Linum perenne]